VVGLLAVSPDRGSGVDKELPHGQLISGSVGSDKLEAGVEAALFGGTRSAEGGFGDGVVLALEDELDTIAGLDTLELRGVEDKATGSNLDLMNDTILGSGGRIGRARVGTVSRSPLGAIAHADGGGDDGLSGFGVNGYATDGRGSTGRGRVSRGRGSSGSGTSSRQSGSLEVGEGVRGAISTAVDGKDHSFAAVAGLGTEHPNGLAIFHDVVDGFETLGLGVSDKVESRVVDGGAIVHQSGAGRCEGALSGSVILLQELEMNDVSGSRKDRLGIIKKLSGSTDFDPVLFSTDKADGEKSDGSSGSKQHC